MADFLDNADVAFRLSLPFGYEARFWKQVLEEVEALEELLSDSASPNSDVHERARSLRNLLHAYV